MKTKFKGTKGQWYIQGDKYATIQSKNNDEKVVVTHPTIATVNSTFISEKEFKANAKLIENAPELLKAIEGFVSDFEGDYVMPDGRIVDNPNILLLDNYEVMKKVLMKTLT